MVGGTDEIRITHLSRGVKAVRIDSALIDGFPAEWIVWLSAHGATIFAIEVDDCLADAAVVVEAHGVVRPFFAGSTGQDRFTGQGSESAWLGIQILRGGVRIGALSHNSWRRHVIRKR